MTEIEPARRRGLADEAADRIRDAIFRGAYPPGTQLREVELARVLDVSRGPVREALLRLEREGLVRSGWHRGATVTELTADDVAELDSLRSALEELAVARVVAHATDQALAAINAVVKRMTVASGELELVGLDMAFHDAVYAAARHRRLEEAWQAIRSQVHLFLLSRVGVSAAGYLAEIPAEHRQLARALSARDEVRALKLFAAHRRHAVDLLSGSVRRRPRRGA